MTGFFRFPRTPHLAWLGSGEPRDDKLLSPEEATALLAGEVVVEEKLDGANLGLSVGADGRLRAQNRGQYLHQPYSGQFARLTDWKAAHETDLRDALGPDLVAFGEWCAALHSLDYSALPGWWVLFDVYDRAVARFWSTARRDQWAKALGLPTVPILFRGTTNLAALKELLSREQSRYRAGPMEGLVVRLEHGDWLQARAKLVCPEFTQSIDAHWRQRPVQWNRLGISA
jgi:ATP-dependent RNA circularization protein (DNA/RNA ligase family)